ncbi:retrotransposon protein, putative, ty1-copia subclass [Tanacetum coccineum]
MVLYLFQGDFVERILQRSLYRLGFPAFPGIVSKSLAVKALYPILLHYRTAYLSSVLFHGVEDVRRLLLVGLYASWYLARSAICFISLSLELVSGSLFFLQETTQIEVYLVWRSSLPLCLVRRLGRVEEDCMYEGASSLRFVVTDSSYPDMVEQPQEPFNGCHISFAGLHASTDGVNLIPIPGQNHENSFLFSLKYVLLLAVMLCIVSTSSCAATGRCFLLLLLLQEYVGQGIVENEELPLRISSWSIIGDALLNQAAYYIVMNLAICEDVLTGVDMMNDRNISVSHLYKDGFVNRFENENTISVSRNNLVYFCAIPRDDIYEIDLYSSNTNDSSMYAISNKRAKLSLDSTLLWHCRLGHISKKRIEKLQHDGLLNSTDIKSFKKCVSCMSGKMARKPYSHQVERAKIYLDYYTPIVSKGVENQLRKIIKSLRSDRGGEYTSQEFLDHLKEHRIIAHRTPPYTPQHNGVSERRNRTLLDMVRFMMSQTTLPKSFWDYALESVACILNMVPTKKVEKTPYEVWHGQAPKLSYLQVWGCEALVKRDTLTKPEKLKPKSIKCIFVGYPKEMMRYSFYYPPENKVFVARNAEFFKNSLITQEASGSLEDLEIIQE